MRRWYQHFHSRNEVASGVERSRTDLIINIHFSHFWLHSLTLLLLKFFTVLFLNVSLQLKVTWSSISITDSSNMGKQDISSKMISCIWYNIEKKNKIRPSTLNNQPDMQQLSSNYKPTIQKTKKHYRAQGSLTCLIFSIPVAAMKSGSWKGCFSIPRFPWKSFQNTMR